MRRYLWPFTGFLSVSIVIAIAIKGGDVSTFPVGWEKSYPVTPYGMDIKNIRITSRGNYIAAVYEGAENKKSGIFISISFDAGAKFFKPIAVAMVDSEIEMNPHVAISSGGHIAVIWQSLVKGDPENRINYSISFDMGATWSDPRRIALSGEMPMLPQVLYGEKDVLHVFYNAYKDRAFNLFHVSSIDEKIFSGPQRLVNIADLRGAF
ncbi:MAG: glycoside hydrolase, partial [Spirochaetes bacterium]|nr:glycoside hydrolase [Spirochaetota bacterium]